MMDNKNIQNTILVQTLLFFMGLIGATAGAFVLSYPEIIAGLLFNHDKEFAMIFGGALFIVGLTDVVLMKTIFNVRERK